MTAATRDLAAGKRLYLTRAPLRGENECTAEDIRQRVIKDEFRLQPASPAFGKDVDDDALDDMMSGYNDAVVAAIAPPFEHASAFRKKLEERVRYACRRTQWIHSPHGVMESLVDSQNDDGSWGDAEHSRRMTMLVLLVCLSYGELGEGQLFGPAFQKGMAYLEANREAIMAEPASVDDQAVLSLLLSEYIVLRGDSPAGGEPLLVLARHAVASLLAAEPRSLSAWQALALISVVNSGLANAATVEKFAEASMGEAVATGSDELEIARLLLRKVILGQEVAMDEVKALAMRCNPDWDALAGPGELTSFYGFMLLCMEASKRDPTFREYPQALIRTAIARRRLTPEGNVVIDAHWRDGADAAIPVQPYATVMSELSLFLRYRYLPLIGVVTGTSRPKAQEVRP
jgi:hypothetical protein